MSFVLRFRNLLAPNADEDHDDVDDVVEGADGEKVMDNVRPAAVRSQDLLAPASG